jgi:hypothetical protein
MHIGDQVVRNSNRNNEDNIPSGTLGVVAILETGFFSNNTDCPGRYIQISWGLPSNPWNYPPPNEEWFTPVIKETKHRYLRILDY